MDLDDYLYGTTSLMGVIRPLRENVVPSFILDKFFPNESIQETENIMFDEVFRSEEMAEFVLPDVIAEAGQLSGYDTKSFKPAYVKMANVIKPKDTMKRIAGEPLGAPWSAGQRMDYLIGSTIQKQRLAIQRRNEWMGLQIAMKGTLTISGKNYPTTTLDFQRAAGNTKALLTTDRWGEAGVSPIADVEAWVEEFADLNGTPPTDIIMDNAATKQLKADPKWKDYLSTDLKQSEVLMSLGFKVGERNAPVHLGYDQNGIHYWSYNPVVTNAAGVDVKLMPANTVILGNSNAVQGSKCYGMIQDFDSLEALDMFSKTYKKDNGVSLLTCETQSAPLVLPGRRNALMCVTVRDDG